MLSIIMWGNELGTLFAIWTQVKQKSLTAASVDWAKEPGKYHDSKGTGLFFS